VPGIQYHKYVCHLPLCIELHSLRMLSCALTVKGYHGYFSGLGGPLRDLPALVQFRADLILYLFWCSSLTLELAHSSAYTIIVLACLRKKSAEADPKGCF
jgi:hypothetical protein